MSRRVRGFLLAPLIPALICAMWAWLRADLETVGLVFVGVLATGYLTLLIVGWPLLAWVSRRGQVNFVQVLAIGASSAIITMAILSAIAPPWRGVTKLQGFLNLISVAIPLGLVAALTLWSVEFRKPGKDQ
jgi:hypothetical protein